MTLELLIGLAAGVLSGLLGVGGGVLIVPALVLLLGLDQLTAEATSLVAIIPAALVGSWRQHAYGNVKIQAGLLIGALSLLGILAGTSLAHALPTQALRFGFAVLLIFTSVRLVRFTLGTPSHSQPTSGPPVMTSRKGLLPAVSTTAERSED